MGSLTTDQATSLLDAALVDGDVLVLVAALGDAAAAGTALTGGSYAPAAIDWDDASGGSKTTAGDTVLTGLPAATLLGWEVWDSTQASRKCFGLFDTLDATATAADDLIRATGHGRVDGDQVVLATAPAGLATGTAYFVVAATADTFQVAASPGGSALDITADGDLEAGSVLVTADGDDLTIPTGSLTVSLS